MVDFNLIVLIAIFPSMPSQLSPPPKLIPWLTSVDFLTKKLHACSGHTQLTVLEHRWINPSWWDRYVLNLECKLVLSREIAMLAWDVPCWYARTIIPIKTYQADAKLFNQLEQTTLGHLIFNGNKINRESLTYYAIDKQSIEYHWLPEGMDCNSEVLWVRLSKFVLASSDPFYLIEIFLPGLEKYLC